MGNSASEPDSLVPRPLSNFLNLHHLRVSVGLKSIPFNPHVPVPLGSAEHSMTRCLEALRNLRDVSRRGRARPLSMSTDADITAYRTTRFALNWLCTRMRAQRCTARA